MIRRSDALVALAFSILFILLAVPFIERLGLYEDETLFGLAVFPPYHLVGYSENVFGYELPLMIMSYVGTLKSILYKLIFSAVDPSLATVRLPMVLAGGATVAIFFYLVRDVAGHLAAILATLLLATDTLFILTTTFDWGTVALQHLLLTTGVFCVLRFVMRGHLLYLAAGFFFFGLAVWDKALAVWLLGGFSVAALLVYPRELWQLATWKNILIAIVSFVIGAGPFLCYNLNHPGTTFKQSAHWSTDDFIRKMGNMKRTIDGSALLGWLANLERDQGGWFLWLLVICAFLLPFCWRRPAFRPVVFTIIAFFAGWVQMVFTKSAGGSVHHSILLWPLPQFAVALILATCADRFGSIAKWGAIVAVAIVSASNLALLNQYRSDMDRFGPSAWWSHSIFALAKVPAVAGAKHVASTDWGFCYALHLIKRGGPPNFPFIDHHGASDPEVAEWIPHDDVVVVRRVRGREMMPGIADALERMMLNQGFVHETLDHVPDEQGNKLFEIYRYRAAR